MEHLTSQLSSPGTDGDFDVHLAMYVMTNQNGPCFVRVNRRAEVQTQMFVGEVITCYRVLVPGNVNDTITGG